MRKRCVGSIPTLSAKFVSRIEKPGLSRLAHNQKVTGSNPVSATNPQKNSYLMIALFLVVDLLRISSVTEGLKVSLGKILLYGKINHHSYSWRAIISPN